MSALRGVWTQFLETNTWAQVQQDPGDSGKEPHSSGRPDGAGGGSTMWSLLKERGSQSHPKHHGEPTSLQVQEGLLWASGLPENSTAER